jgi:hypothetical protein
MSFITSDTIRDISVKTVETFLNDKVPLSVGLSKHASALELNSDQIQRAVEATNCIAYLKIKSLSDDRTSEFPLCKFAEVMTQVFTPSMTKAASFHVPVAKGESLLEKIAEYCPTELNATEQLIMFTKLAAINSKELEILQDRAFTIVPELLKAAAVIKSDSQGLEKLATVTSGKEYSMATALIYGEVQTFADTGIFKQAELKTAEHLITLLKEAHLVQDKINEKERLAESSEIVKQAFLGMVGQAIGRGIAGAVKLPMKAMSTSMDTIAKGMGGGAANAARRVAGIAPVAKPKTVGKATAAMATAGLVADAHFYKPGIDKTTGRSKDVWTALQRETN